VKKIPVAYHPLTGNCYHLMVPVIGVNYDGIVCVFIGDFITKTNQK